MTAKQVARDVYGAVTSKTAQRTLVYTAFLAFGSVVLYGLAVLAYLLFYHNYLPDQVRTIPIHLQYGYELNPYGMADIRALNLKELQDYDIKVTLRLPRSPVNTERGNFMLELFLMDTPGIAYPALVPPQRQEFLEAANPVVFSSFRPAILPYSDRLVSRASRLLFLPYHVLFPFAETTKLEVQMAERVSFPRGSRLPASLFLEVKAGQTLQTYAAEVVFVAKLRGLRWFMYNYWVTSFLVLTTAFWGVEVLFMVLSFVAWGILAEGGKPAHAGLVKNEDGSPPGKQPAIKQEGEEEEKRGQLALTQKEASPESQQVAPANGEEAGDEEDDDEGEQIDPTEHKSSGGPTTSSHDTGLGGFLRRRSSQRHVGSS